MHSFLLVLWATLLAAPIGGCRDGTATRPAPTAAGTVTVFAAASLAEAFGDIKAAFERRHPGVTVTLSLGGSQQLRGQIEHGAPADVFASANTKEMDALVAGGHVAPGAARAFARNRLVVACARGGRGGGVTSLADLARPGVKLVVADQAVPAGAYTLRMLDAMAKDPAFGEPFKAGVLRNVVSREENVKAVVRKVQLGEADAGVCYATDVGPELADRVGTIGVADPFNPPADYPIAPLAKAKDPDRAAAFVAFVLSPEGRSALAKRGFLPPQAATRPAAGPDPAASHEPRP